MRFLKCIRSRQKPLVDPSTPLDKGTARGDALTKFELLQRPSVLTKIGSQSYVMWQLKSRHNSSSELELPAHASLASHALGGDPHDQV